MSESSLAPETSRTERLSNLSFDRPIPKAVRAFGKALDPKILLPGDLLLVAHSKPSWRSRSIVSQQSQQFADEHARWHHAVVCGGGFEICEATMEGVKATEYWDYMNANYELKLRRLKDASPEERSRVAYYAVTNVRVGYGFFNLFGIARALATGQPWAVRSILGSSGVICSQLYFEACLRAGFVLASAPAEHVCPAHLSISPQMVDIPLGWVPV